jgi:thioredoxin reductase (NADPH)
MQEKVFEKQKEGKIDIDWDTEVVEMLGEDKLEKVKLKTKAGTKQADKLKQKGLSMEEKEGYIYWEKQTDGVFVAIGHVPASDIFKGKIELDEKGYIAVEEKTKTNIEGVFVAGDVHDYHYKQAITAAGFGCMAGMDCLKYLDKSTPGW